MPISELLLPEFDGEMKKTRTALERVPMDKKDYAPHSKSTPLGKLAPHVAQLAGLGLIILTTPELDFGKTKMPAVPFDSTAQLIKAFDDGAAQARTALKNTKDEAWTQPWKLSFGDKPIFIGTRFLAYRQIFLNHLVHQRARLGVYLRLNHTPRLSQSFLNPPKLLVLGGSIGTRSRPRFDLNRASRHRKIGNKRVFAFARAMRDHRSVSIAACQVDRVQSLADRPDLVDLDQNRISDMLMNSLLQPLHIRHEQVIAHQLNLVAQLFGQHRPAVPVVFSKAVFEGHDGVVIHPLRPVANHVFRSLR